MCLEKLFNMIIIRLAGGLGNQMFQYAMGLSLSKRLNQKFKLDTSFLLDRKPRENFVFRDYDLDIFNLEINNFEGLINYSPNKFVKNINKFLPNKYKSIFSENSFEYQNYFEKISKNNIYLEGYWQSPRYFQSIKNDIINSFKIKVEHDEKVNELLNEIKSIESVCLNVRRGDFVNNPFHGTMGVDYYTASIMKLKNMIGEKFKIFVFSDDIEWCIENLQFTSPVYFVKHEFKGFKFSSYFHLMTNCKHFIIPNSSFAWWAAYLSPDNNKIIITPQKWFNTDIDTNDLIPDTWIRI